MSTTTTITSGFAEFVFQSFLDSRDEPDWAVQRRRAAYDQYRQLLSEPLDPEEFKRVDLRTLRPDRYSLENALAAAPQSEASHGVQTLMQNRADYGGAVLHVDGRCVHASLSDQLASRGVLFGDLAQLMAEHADVLEPHLMTRGVTADADRFAAWHSAFWTGGTVLYVPRGVEVDVPLYSLISLAGDGATDFSHTLVILEEGASATLLEETGSASAEAEGLHVGAVELMVADGARLRYVQLQNWNEKVRHFARQVGRAGRDAMLQWTVGALGSKLAHIHQHVHLDGPGAQAQVNGCTFATDRQLISYYTQQSHHAANTQSDLLYKEVCRDQSRVVWRGMIRVDHPAQKTDGYQRNDALMLSRDARVDAIPGLEIEADDVRCTHGATAGRVDDEQVLYCMCRGLSRYEAMHLIVEGFFAEVYDRIPVELVRETLSQAVERKLGIGD